MIAAWITYGLVVSALLCFAAILVEKAARWIGLATRWGWAAAIGLGWALPYLASGSGRPPRGPAGAGGLQHAIPPDSSAGGIVSGLQAFQDRLTDSVAATWSAVTEMSAVMDVALLLFWIAAAGILLSALAITYRRLRIRAGTWPVRDIHGHRVRVSEDLGPAVLGVGRGQVVLPRWAVESPPSHQRLMVLHEAEHLRAGDERLLFAAVVAVALMPWNLFAWWQLSRLRLAVELDCDGRVLKAGVQIREYASLLLEAGSRRGASPMAAAAFVHFHSQLGRRIREMTEKRKGPRYLPAALAAMGALIVLVAACETPTPMDPAGLREITDGKQVSHVDRMDDAELQLILEQEGDVTLVVEEVDGETYVIDAVKMGEIREKGHAGLMLEKLKEHGKLAELRFTLVHEDGAESASFGTLLQAEDPEANELVELQPVAEGEYRFREVGSRSTMKPRSEAEAVKIRQLRAVETEARMKVEGGSR